MRIRFDATAGTPFLTLDSNVPSWERDLNPRRADGPGREAMHRKIVFAFEPGSLLAKSQAREQKRPAG